MSTTASFLNQTYGAYDHREIPKEDEELTHVGPGTPCGEYFRRFWLPIALSEELKDLPVARKLLDEELVIFRDGGGQVGLLELHCSHRGTSLEFGLIEKKGIRCCYHGWQFDVDGRILDTPGEPPDSTYKERLCHGAYPVHEYKGVVFAYMGPPDKKPPLPLYDTFEMPGYRYEYVKEEMPCNWLQIVENSMDPVHTTFLHARSSGIQFSDGFIEMPEMDYMETPIGMVYLATRRIGNNLWLRMNDLMPPNLHQINRNEEDGKEEHPYRPGSTSKWQTPIDNTHTLEITMSRYPENQPPRPRFLKAEERPYEQRQRYPADYDAQVGQRTIAIHALEHRVTTDRGVNMFRNMVRDGVRAVQRGEDPLQLSRKAGEIIPTYCNDTVERILPAPTPEEDRKLLRETGRRWAEGYLKSPPTTTGGPMWKPGQ